jgi:uncharacterized protein involved in exopolysaccharide biosynthesis
MAISEDCLKVWQTIRQRRALALTVFLVVFGLGIVISFLLPKKYTSSMEILIRATPSDLRATPERADGVQIGQVTEEEVNSEVALLTSYDLLRDAVVTNNLNSPMLFSDPTQRVDAATRKLGQELNVSAVRKANIIEVTYSANSPQLAASVLRSIEGGYLEAHQRAQSMPGGYHFFAAEMQYYKDQLAEKQRAFAEFSDHEGAANLDQQLTLLTRTISDQESSLQQAQAQAAELSTQIGKSNAIVSGLPFRIDTTRRTVPNASAIDHITSLIAELEDRRTQQATKYRDDDRLVKQTDEEIEEAKKELQDAKTLAANELSTDVNPITQSLQGTMENRTVDLAGLQSRTAELEKEIASNRSRVNHLTDVSGQYRLLLSDVQNAQDDYNNYVQRQEDARVSERLDTNKISNIVVAQEPTESVLPVASHRLLVLTFSFFAAIFASIAACLMASAFRPALKIQHA